MHSSEVQLAKGVCVKAKSTQFLKDADFPALLLAGQGSNPSGPLLLPLTILISTQKSCPQALKSSIGSGQPSGQHDAVSAQWTLAITIVFLKLIFS